MVPGVCTNYILDPVSVHQGCLFSFSGSIPVCSAVSMKASHCWLHTAGQLLYAVMRISCPTLQLYALKQYTYVVEGLMCSSVQALSRSSDMRALHAGMHHQRCHDLVLLLCVGLRSWPINKLEVCHALQCLQSLQCCAISRSARMQTRTCVVRIYVCVYLYIYTYSCMMYAYTCVYTYVFKHMCLYIHIIYT